MKAGAMTLGAVIALTACASEPKTTATTASPSMAATTPAPSTTIAATMTTMQAPANSSATAIGAGSGVAVRMCVDALVDDPSAPGAHFVERLQKLSVGYPMVEPLTAAQELCGEARAQLEVEVTTAELSSDLLAGTEAINAALDLAAQQIRMDAFYLGGSVPPQFIPDGAEALRQSIEAYYSRALVALG